MRRKRRRRKRTVESQGFITYKFEDIEINSAKQLEDKQVFQICNSIIKIINSNNFNTSYEITRQILVQMKGTISGVKCDSNPFHLVVYTF